MALKALEVFHDMVSLKRLISLWKYQEKATRHFDVLCLMTGIFRFQFKWVGCVTLTLLGPQIPFNYQHFIPEDFGWKCVSHSEIAKKLFWSQKWPHLPSGVSLGQLFEVFLRIYIQLPSLQYFLFLKWRWLFVLSWCSLIRIFISQVCHIFFCQFIHHVLLSL